MEHSEDVQPTPYAKKAVLWFELLTDMSFIEMFLNSLQEISNLFLQAYEWSRSLALLKR